MLCFLFLLAFGSLAYSQSATTLGGFPLAVKTPYLHSWIFNVDQEAPRHVWPRLFNQAKILGWNGMIRVDGQPYQWLGDNVIVTNYTNTIDSEVTPTKTIFTIQAGHMKFNATFFTPIEPNDYIRQSIPFTYLFVDGFTADDGQPHTVQLYSDISAEWVSHDESTLVDGNTTDSKSMIYHRVQPKSGQPSVENSDSAEDATGYYATPKRPGLTWQTDIDITCRTRFAQNGNLTNAGNTTTPGPVNKTGAWPVFSFAIDLGSIAPNAQPDPVIWALGLVRDPVITYVTDSGPQSRASYYRSAYRTTDDVISDFLGDFVNAKDRGQTFDDSILNKALEVSPQYAGILSLVTRQVFASMDITIPSSKGGGQPSASDVKIFMKDISVSARANPVEVIYAAFPALLYFNSSFAHDLLLPLFELQDSPSYPKGYASPDLGTRYPTVSSNTSDTEELAIEHCGNMLIMAYAHASKSGDGSLIVKYRSLLQKWAEYLVQHSLRPNNAISADGIGYPDGMSNLALKGILGVYSMGKIDEAIDPSETNFKDKASEIIKNWTQLAANSDHIQADYGKQGTWGLMYNLFPAVWLRTDLIGDKILNNEAQFYQSHEPSGNHTYSLDSDKGSGSAYPHWAFMTAAMIPDGFKSVRDVLIQSTYLQAYNVSQDTPLPVKYQVSNGLNLTGTTGSAAQGAAYGILAKGMPNVSIDTKDFITKKKVSAGAIAGGVIGGVAFLLLVAGAIFFWRRRKMRQPKVVIDPQYEEERAKPHPFSPPHSPINNNENGTLLTWKRKRGANIGPSHRPGTAERHSGLQDTEGPSSSKEREASQQNQSHQDQSEPAESEFTNARSAEGHERRETWRAEVEELRREMEAIRDIAQPPPSYR